MLSEMVLSWRLSPQGGPHHVSQLFKKARVWCKQQAVTGMVVFDGEWLMASLEAERTELIHLLERLQEDCSYLEVRLHHLQSITMRTKAHFQAGYVLEDDLPSEPRSALAPLTQLHGDQAKMAFDQLDFELI